jgi:hypothetical protein
MKVKQKFYLKETAFSLCYFFTIKDIEAYEDYLEIWKPLLLQIRKPGFLLHKEDQALKRVQNINYCIHGFM